jgi:hypothetical protein
LLSSNRNSNLTKTKWLTLPQCSQALSPLSNSNKWPQSQEPQSKEVAQQDQLIIIIPTKRMGLAMEIYKPIKDIMQMASQWERATLLMRSSN